VRDAKAVDDVVQGAIQKAGKIDILVNSAAGNFLCPIKDLSINAFKTVMAIDATGTFAVSQSVYKHWMREVCIHR
jgi:2,4-dienoyl-CoA reductase [(3E)-enoyl-CoA-producing], peroxisomal